MSPSPQPKPGQTFGEAVLEQGRQAGRLDTSIVSSLDEGSLTILDDVQGLSAPEDNVPVVYVETSRIDPKLNSGMDPLEADTFEAGSSAGTAYIYDRASRSFRCMADVRATNSALVTATIVRGRYGEEKNRSVMSWFQADLIAAIERAITEGARTIVTLEPGKGADAGSTPRAAQTKSGSRRR